MGLFIRQNENRSELQSKLADELKGKLSDQKHVDSKEVDPKFLEGSHKSTAASMVMIVLGAILVVAFVAWFVIHSRG